MSVTEVEAKLDEFFRFVKAQGWTVGDVRAISSHLSSSLQVLKMFPTSEDGWNGDVTKERVEQFFGPGSGLQSEEVAHRGRPKGVIPRGSRKRSKAALRAIVSALRCGATYGEAARKANMTKETLTSWRHDDHQFGKICMIARRQGVDNPIEPGQEVAPEEKRKIARPPRGSNAFICFEYIREHKERVTLKHIVDKAVGLHLKYNDVPITPQILAERYEQIFSTTSSTINKMIHRYSQILNYGDHSYQWVGE